MESSQPITLDERLGKVPKPDSNFGNKNQFESWDFPKPSQQMEGDPGNLFRTDCVIMIHTQAPRYECVTENYFSDFSTKTYVVGTQKDRLDETVLLSTQNTCLNWWVRK